MWIAATAAAQSQVAFALGPRLDYQQHRVHRVGPMPSIALGASSQYPVASTASPAVREGAVGSTTTALAVQQPLLTSPHTNINYGIPRFDGPRVQVRTSGRR